jgi:hypothetical protein
VEISTRPATGQHQSARSIDPSLLGDDHCLKDVIINNRAKRESEQNSRYDHDQRHKAALLPSTPSRSTAMMS